jgi:glycosyltransferase involved in cell wall biosynthesis
MQNICFFNSTSFWGGGEKSHLEYAINFRKKNYKVFIITSRGSVLEQKANEQQLPVFGFKIGNLSFLNPLKVKRLANFFVEKQIDTVFLNSSPDLKLGGLAARKAGVKNIVYMRGLAIPVKNNLLNRFLLGKIVTHAVPNSLDTRKKFLTNLSFLTESKVPVIYRGINFEDWDKRPVEHIDFRNNNEVIIGNVGRLVKQKGQDFLIVLARKLIERGLNFKLVIAGVGPLEEELRKNVSLQKLEEYIFFTGFFTNIKSFLCAIDIFVFPSLWEGFGNAMVEAMYEKKPVVAFRLSSNPEIVSSGETGFLVDYPNMDEFAEAVFNLAKDPGLRKQIGEKARISVKSRFSFEAILEEWEKLLP